MLFVIGKQINYLLRWRLRQIIVRHSQITLSFNVFFFLPFLPPKSHRVICKWLSTNNGLLLCITTVSKCVLQQNLTFNILLICMCKKNDRLLPWANLVIEWLKQIIHFSCGSRLQQIFDLFTTDKLCYSVQPWAIITVKYFAIMELREVICQDFLKTFKTG